MRVRLSGFVVLGVWMIMSNLLCASESAAGVEETRQTSSALGVETTPSWRTEGELLRRAQLANEDIYSSLRSFVCDESIQRTRENLARTKSRKLDTLTTKVSFENGREQYSDVRQNRVVRAGLSAAGGAWSEGEFGTLLRQTQQLLKTQQVILQRYDDQDGTPAAFFQFDVSQEDSPWTLVVEGQSYKLPFRTEVVVELSTGHILSVKREAAQLPRELCIAEIEWAVKMRPTDLAGGNWLLPVQGEYAVAYAYSNRRERNQMSFGNYRRYGSEVALRFDPMN